MMQSLCRLAALLALSCAAAGAFTACQDADAGRASHAAASSTSTSSVPPAPATITRGAYLATLGNCAGCHTAPGGASYAGGTPITTPFGTVYATNLTPDPDTGLGRWTADDFWRALHHGRSRDGRRLLPAFPYTSYTQVRREDSDALFAYLQSLPAVKQANRAQDLRFPYNTPLAIAAWQALYFHPADPPPAQLDTTPVGRGAYLVNGLGHCTACHAPRNRWGAPSKEPSGGEMPGEPWFAPSLHPSQSPPRPPDELAQLLRSGRTDRATVSGPMAAVVFQSLQHWTDADLQAVAAYLGSLEPVAPAAPELADPAVLQAGGKVYAARCADCHGPGGEGRPGRYPALAGNATVQHPNARNLVQLMRHGSFGPSTRDNPLPHSMPHQGLSNADMAAVASFVRQSWGNRAPAVTEIEVMHLQ